MNRDASNPTNTAHVTFPKSIAAVAITALAISTACGGVSAYADTSADAANTSATETTGTSTETVTPTETKDALAAAGVMTSSPISTSTDADSALVVTLNGVTVDVPKSPDQPTEMTIPGGPVEFGLPAVAESTAQRVGNDAMVYTSNDGASQVVNMTGTPELPALQFLTTIADANAPRAYEFPIALSPGQSLRLVTTDAGERLEVVNSAGEILVQAPEPWLKDANGVEIENSASYSLDGNTVTMHVDLDKVDAFPAVADPAWMPLVAGAAARAAIVTALKRCGVGAAEGAWMWLFTGRKSLSELVGASAAMCTWNNLPSVLKHFVRRR